MLAGTDTTDKGLAKLFKDAIAKEYEVFKEKKTSSLNYEHNQTKVYNVKDGKAEKIVVKDKICIGEIDITFIYV